MFRRLSILLISSIFISIFMITNPVPRGTNISKSHGGGLNIYNITESSGAQQSKILVGKGIRPGDIVLVRGSTWIDQLIKKITRSNYTHVAGVVKPNVVVDILPFAKTGYKSLRLFSGKADVYTCDRLSDEQRKKIVKYVNGKIGTSYDYFLVAWQASRYMFNWVWPYKANNSNLCSTLWADAYREVGVELCPDIVFPSPKDLANSNLLRKVWSY